MYEIVTDKERMVGVKFINLKSKVSVKTENSHENNTSLLNVICSLCE